VRLWQPRGPKRLEVWSWGLAERGAPPAVAEFSRKMQILTFSPSGIFEQDDGEMGGQEEEKGHDPQAPLQMGRTHAHQTSNFADVFLVPQSVGVSRFNPPSSENFSSGVGARS